MSESNQLNQNNSEIKEFRAVIKTQRFASEDFKIYVADVDTKLHKDIKRNKEGKFIVCGNVHTLVPNVEYIIKAKEEINKNYGVQYKILNIKRDKPTNKTSAKKFLKEVINDNQARVLLEVYPNIIDKVIKNDIDDIDLSLTKGIKEFTFDKIKNKIIENFCLIDLIDKFDGLLDFNVLKKLYKKYPSPEIIERKFKQNPYKCLCSLNRIGFKTADNIILSLEEKTKEKQEKGEECIQFDYDIKPSKERMKACLEYILQDNENNGHTKMDIKSVRRECTKLTPHCINHFVDVIKDSNSIYLDKNTKSLSTKKAYDTEIYICKTLIEMLNNSSNLTWNIQTELYREDDGISLTDEQLEALNKTCKYNVSLLTAPAGSGKSQSIKMIVNMLEDNNKTHLLCSPTGKASEILAEYVGRDAGTIHRQLNYNPSNGDNPWGYNKENKLDVDMVIVDEFSMVDIYLMKHLLDAIDINKTKILLVFDSYQLSSVGCGNIAHDLLTSGIIPTTYLTKIFRYNEGGLMQVVTKIRNGEQFLPSTFKGVKVFGTKKDYVYIETPQTKIIDEVLKIYDRLLKNGESFENIMVLSCYNKGDYGTKAINEKIQNMVQKNNDKYVQKGNTRFYLDDKVIQTANNYKAKNIYGEETEEVYNGNTGIMVKKQWNELIVQFKNKQILYDKTDLENLELGYCISNHKSQGSSCKNVILVTPKAHGYMLNSNLLYVGGTRAKVRVFHIGNIATINKAIKKKENLQRNTFLCDLLKSEYNKTA